MDQILQMVLQWAGLLGLTLAGVAGAAYGLFIRFGGKWLERKFAERLQTLQAAQERSLRLVQSTIDREIHRAKKLYDNEFTALSDSWRMLRAAYEEAASSIASSTTDVSRMNNAELERHLAKRGMEEWQRDEFKAMPGSRRQDEYYKWSEWQRCRECIRLWSESRLQSDSTSIFFPDGFPERFRALNDMIAMSNAEFEEQIREYKAPKGGTPYDTFAVRKELRAKGKAMMDELEGMVRGRIWSVAKEGEAGPR